MHSLCGYLWKQKNFGPKYGSDLRKRSKFHVDERFFLGTFIHSFQVHTGDTGQYDGPE